jgi:hypothetical protein
MLMKSFQFLPPYQNLRVNSGEEIILARLHATETLGVKDVGAKGGARHCSASPQVRRRASAATVAAAESGVAAHMRQFVTKPPPALHVSFGDG